MNKCDFCIQSTSNERCKKNGYFNNPYIRELYYKEAIEKMINFLQKMRLIRYELF